MTRPVQTRMTDDGLRYAAKVGGSPFAGSATTMSCFLCGTHRQRVQLQGRRLLGRIQQVCKPSCAGAP